MQELTRLLKDSPRVVASELPRAPTQFLDDARASSHFLDDDSRPRIILHLCRIWLDAGWTDREWAEALHMFETELCDQPKQQPKGGVPISGTQKVGEEEREGRWTLETFSMWLLKRGRRLRECAQWFRAFDFDQDDMVGVVDFIQGLVAVAAPRLAAPANAGGLCSAFALFRLLELETKQLEPRYLEDAHVQLKSIDPTLTPEQLAQRAGDFEYFRSTIMPRLQGTTAYRLRVFGPSASIESGHSA